MDFQTRITVYDSEMVVVIKLNLHQFTSSLHSVLYQDSGDESVQRFRDYLIKSVI
jgi:hypothetical protein